MNLGIALRSCRMNASLTQLQLAQLIHCDRTYITKVETGDIDPRFTFVQLWLDVTDAHEYFATLLGIDWPENVAKLQKLEKIEQILA